MELKEKIDRDKLPRHIAVIMDGNGRWARQKGKARVFGHKNGVTSVREVTEAAAELGIEYITLYAFSTENWNRPREEVEALMALLVNSLSSETKTLMKNNIRLLAIGDLEGMPAGVRKKLQASLDKTAGNTGTSLVLALSYSSRWEIAEATRQIAEAAKKGEIEPKDINDDLLRKYMSTKDIPDPDMLIRTSGENRISNFLLWQLAYTELYFTDTLWPDFRKEDLHKAVLDYQKRERRFGKTSEQL